ncbi:MAG: hypothetical protein ABR562_09740, partial [Thermoplasmatota archaeon]
MSVRFIAGEFIEQGEAPTTAHPDAHFVIFDTIRKELEQAVAAASQPTSFVPFATGAHAPAALQSKHVPHAPSEPAG